MHPVEHIPDDEAHILTGLQAQIDRLRVEADGPGRNFEEYEPGLKRSRGSASGVPLLALYPSPYSFTHDLMIA